MRRERNLAQGSPWRQRRARRPRSGSAARSSPARLSCLSGWTMPCTAHHIRSCSPTRHAFLCRSTLHTSQGQCFQVRPPSAADTFIWPRCTPRTKRCMSSGCRGCAMITGGHMASWCKPVMTANLYSQEVPCHGSRHAPQTGSRRPFPGGSVPPLQRQIKPAAAHTAWRAS